MRGQIIVESGIHKSITPGIWAREEKFAKFPDRFIMTFYS
jgi:hypothetical protein